VQKHKRKGICPGAQKRKSTGQKKGAPSPVNTLKISQIGYLEFVPTLESPSQNFVHISPKKGKNIVLT
jgi:hypothetical protein